MAKDDSLFSSLNKDMEDNIFVVSDYMLTIASSGSIDCENGVISNVYLVPQLSANLLHVPQITHIGKKVEFWPNNFVVKDIDNNFIVVFVGTLDPKEKLYEFYVF
jgi:hypothetical protein